MILLLHPLKIFRFLIMTEDFFLIVGFKFRDDTKHAWRPASNAKKIKKAISALKAKGPTAGGLVEKGLNFDPHGYREDSKN